MYKFLIPLMILILVACHSESPIDSEKNPPASSLQCDIYFYPNGGKGSMDKISGKQGSTVTLPKNKFTKKDYQFIGWSTSTENENVTFLDEEEVTLNKTQLNLYAVWKQNAYTLSFDSNGGEGQMSNVHGEKGSSINLPKNKFTKKGYTFKGWSKNKEITSISYPDQGEFTFSQKTETLYAIWEETKICLVSFDPNGGTGEMKPIEVTQGDDFLLPDPEDKISRFNHTFFAWGLDPAGIYKYPAGAKIKIEQDTTLYALWKIIDDNLGGNCDEFKGTTQWVKGIIPPAENEWKPVFGWSEDKLTAVWKPGKGWYDTDQFYDNLCWAATASNLLHWWLEQNESYITRFGYDGPKEYRHSRDSEIYNFFKENFANKGNQTRFAFVWFIAGQDSKEGAAFFADVFSGKILTNTHFSINRRVFNEVITDAFKHNKGLGITYAGHEVTVWGARYGTDGYVDRLYYSQSNDYEGAHTIDGENAGMIYMNIEYQDGKPMTESSVPGKYIYISGIQSYELGQEIWMDYFKN